MTINNEEYQPIVGLEDLYYALVTKDDDTDYTAGTPKLLSWAAEASPDAASDMATDYFDNKPKVNAFARGPVKIALDISNLPLITLAEITGNIYDAVNGMIYEGEGVPPDCALLFKSKKKNGNFKYYQYYKGNFDMPKESFKTAKDKVEFQHITLNFTAIFTTHKFTTAAGRSEALVRNVGDEDIGAFDGSDWFDQVTVPPETPGTSV